MNAEELHLEKKWAFGQIRIEVHDGLLERKPSGDVGRGTGRYVSEILIDGGSDSTCIRFKGASERCMLTLRGARPQAVRWRPDESDQIAMKFTQYFLHRRTRGDRKRITDEWIQRALDAPLQVEIQSDGRYRQWVWIAEERKYLRIVLLEDRQTVHNAFFDRSFKESKG